MNAFDEEFEDEFDDIIYEPTHEEISKHVMTKEEFVTRLTADLAARKKQRIALAKQREHESKSYIVDKMIYNRKKRNRR